MLLHGVVALNHAMPSSLEKLGKLHAQGVPYGAHAGMHGMHGMAMAGLHHF